MGINEIAKLYWFYYFYFPFLENYVIVEMRGSLFNKTTFRIKLELIWNK